MIPEIGKSTLIGTTGLFVGFGYGSHILKKDWFISVCFYHIKNNWIICMSEGSGKFDVKSQKSGLGKKVSGENLIPYAVRCIGGLPYQEFRDIMNQELKITIPDIKFEWFEGKLD